MPSGITCSCCGWALGSFVPCPTCGKYFAWRCLLPHRKREHYYRPDPEEAFRYRYLTSEG